MTIQDRKSIFALCRELNINDEERHNLVYGVTGKTSLTELSEIETKAVIKELTERMKFKNRPVTPQKHKSESVPGMMTAEQQSLAWRLVYRLRELDERPKLHENGTPYTVGERVAGAITKILGITTYPGKDIFRWVSFDDGTKLIEGLKRYVRSAERAAERKR